MANSAYWFRHDTNAKDDHKIMLLMDQLGLEGYGIFWVLIETLREQSDYRYPMAMLPILAKRYMTSAEKMKAVVLNYGLFEVLEDDHFASPSLLKRMEAYEDVLNKKRIAGAKGGKKRAENQASAKQVPSTSQASAKHVLKQTQANRVDRIREEVNIREREREYSGSLVSSARAREADFPSLSDVVEFFSDAGFTVYQAEQFHAHLIRGDPPKDWRAAATAWTSENVNKHKRHNGAATTAKKQNGDPHAIANWEFVKACEQRDADAGKIDPCEQDYPGR